MSQRRRNSSSVSTVHIVAGLVLLLLILIGMVYLLAPDKPEAPPPSTLSYERPPAPEARPVVFQTPEDREEPSSPPLPTDEITPPQPFQISGTVIDSKTGEAISRAYVNVSRWATVAEKAYLQERNEEVIASGDTAGIDRLTQEERQFSERGSDKTNSRGRFRVALSMAGEYKIHVTHHGYLEAEPQFVTLSEKTKTQTVEIAMSRGATISGRVTESGSSVGAPGLTVHARCSEPDKANCGEGVIETDEDGYYSIGGLIPAEYEVWLEMAGVAPTVEEAFQNMDRKRSVPYMAGKELPYQRVTLNDVDEERKGIDFKVDAAGIVWGYVTDMDKEPVQAGLLMVTSQSIVSQALTKAYEAMTKKTPPIFAKSGEDGYYEMVGVPLNQEWRIYGKADDYATQLTDPFMVTPTQRNARIDIYLFDGTTVYGQVVDSNRNPVDNAEVICIPGFEKLLSPMDTPQAFDGTQTDEDGRFEITQLPAGTYQMFAMKKGYRYSLMGEPVYPDGYNDIQNFRITLDPVVAGNHEIFGTVIDTQGNPVADAGVEVGGFSVMALDDMQKKTTSDEEGRYYIGELDAGMYMMQVEKEGYASSHMTRVRLNEATEVVLEAGARILGRVVVQETGSAPEGGFSISATPAMEADSISFSMLEAMADGTSQHFENTDGNGRFELALAAGRYQLEAKASGLTAGRVTLDLKPGEVENGVTLYLSRSGGRIEGLVTTADGKTPQGAVVTLAEVNPLTANFIGMMATMNEFGGQSQRVDQGGAFSFDQLPTGDYTLVVQHPGYAQSQSAPITVVSGDTVRGVEIRLGAGGVLEGYVSKGGRAQANAMILLMAAGTPMTANSDDKGFYHFDDVPAGTHQATLVPVGNLSNPLAAASLSAGIQNAYVMIEDGQVTRYDFGDESGVTLIGHCEPATFEGAAMIRFPQQEADDAGLLGIASQLGGLGGADIENGTFTIPNVSPGAWLIELYPAGAREGDLMGMLFQQSMKPVHTQFVEISGEEDTVETSIRIDTSLEQFLETE
jgi:protocatechuate 3,4-dioxygenase beta subunit